MSIIEFIDHDAWRHITARVKRQRSRCHAAIAYFGMDGSELLPLRRGSVLVVNASEDAVRAGQTHPGELLKLIQKGVAVYSFATLHAKVVVVGNEVFVGSMNVSRRSERYLVEAAIRTDHRIAVSKARQFVESLTLVDIGPEEARRLMSLYRPPKLPPLSGDRRRQPKPVGALLNKPLWIARIQTIPWDDDDYAAEKRGLPTAKRRLRDSKRFEVDDFVWEGGGLANLRRGDRLIYVHEESNRRSFVTAPASVLHVEKYTKHGGRRRLIFFEVQKGRRRRSINRVLQGLSPQVRLFLRKSHGRSVPSLLVDDLLHACRPSV